MKMKKMIYFLFALMILGANSMKAQVRIGGSDNPNPAAILDLNATDAANNGTLGLALPRVELKNTAKASASIANPTNGMVVYNTKAENNVVVGLYYFNGTSWVLLNSGTMDVGVTNVSTTISGLTVNNGATTPSITITGTHDATEYLNGSGNWSTPTASLPAGTAVGQILRWNGTAWVVGFPPQTGTLNDVEGNTYSYACFGAAGCWMTENLRVTKYAHDKDVIVHKNGVMNISDYNKREWEYAGGKDSVNNLHTYGLVYTWVAASNRTSISDNETYKTDQPQYQGICPDGWHLPSADEWDSLIGIIGADASGSYSSLTTAGSAATKMRSPDPVGGVQPDGKSNSNANNGFDMPNTSQVDLAGAPWNYGQYACLWLSNNVNASSALRTYAENGNSAWSKGQDMKSSLSSVRCKKN